MTEQEDFQHKLSTNSQNSLPEKIENLKEWSIRTFKCTKQSLEERLGLSKPSIDPMIQGKIDELSMMNLLCVNQRELSCQFNTLAYQHQDIAGNFKRYSQELKEFRDNLKTVTFKAIQDTLLTVDKKFTTARLEYDYLLNEIKNEVNKNQKNNNQKAEVETSPQTQEKLRQLKENYDRLSDDVDVKIRLVNENRIRVVKGGLYTLTKCNKKLFDTEGTCLGTDPNFAMNPQAIPKSFLEVA